LEYFAANHTPFTSIFRLDRRRNLPRRFDLQIDHLTVVMVLVVTARFLIHIYSTGSFPHEGGYYRFFPILNLFMFLHADPCARRPLRILLFVGGKASASPLFAHWFFYFSEIRFPTRGKKSFIVNRIGDFGFYAWHVFCCSTFGTLDFRRAGSAKSPSMAG